MERSFNLTYYIFFKEMPSDYPIPHEIFLPLKKNELASIISNKNDVKYINFGIWDVLGEYETITHTIKIYENGIEEFCSNVILKNEQYKRKFSDKEIEILPLLVREIVRVHEHAHGIIRCTGNVIRVNEKSEDVDFQLNNKLEESLAELLTATVINNYGNDAYTKLFDILDEYTPSFYRDWKILEMFLKTLGNSVKERIPLKWVLVLIEYIKEEKIDEISEIDEEDKNEVTRRIILKYL